MRNNQIKFRRDVFSVIYFTMFTKRKHLRRQLILRTAGTESEFNGLSGDEAPHSVGSSVLIAYVKYEAINHYSPCGKCI